MELSSSYEGDEEVKRKSSVSTMLSRKYQQHVLVELLKQIWSPGGVGGGLGSRCPPDTPDSPQSAQKGDRTRDENRL